VGTAATDSITDLANGAMTTDLPDGRFLAPNACLSPVDFCALNLRLAIFMHPALFLLSDQVTQLSLNRTKHVCSAAPQASMP
jgi:hypothetical protein